LEEESAPRVFVQDIVLLVREFILFDEDLLTIVKFPKDNEILVTE
jgi:hypothetical protein